MHLLYAAGRKSHARKGISRAPASAAAKATAAPAGRVPGNRNAANNLPNQRISRVDCAHAKQSDRAPRRKNPPGNRPAPPDAPTRRTQRRVKPL